MRSCGKLSGVNRTCMLSCAASVMARSNAILPMRPRSVPLTALLERFRTSVTTVRSALRAVQRAPASGPSPVPRPPSGPSPVCLPTPAVSTRLTTSGYRTTTSPLAVTYAGCQSPMFLSGGDGFQSTHVVWRSAGSGANTSTASPLVPLCTASVTSSSTRRYVPAMLLESARRFPLSQMFAR